MRNYTPYLTVFLISLLVFSCKTNKEEEPEIVDFDRSIMLENYAEIISVEYTQYSSEMIELNNRVDAFTNNANLATLQSLREQWSATLIQWQRVLPFEFGIAAQNAMEANNNVFPIDATIIETNIESGEYDLASISNLAAVGLQAIDYLIHGTSQTDEEIIASFTSGELALNRATYLQDLMQRMVEKATIVSEAWEPNNQNYTDFILNDGTSQGSSTGLFLNSFIQRFEKSIRSNKLGIPAGALTFSMEPIPDRVEAYFENDQSVTYLKEAVKAYREFYTGNDGIGLDDYLETLDATIAGESLNEAILDQLDITLEKIDELNDPLSEFVSTNQLDALDVYGELQELVVLWKVDMMSAFGILITYQDNDGD